MSQADLTSEQYHFLRRRSDVLAHDLDTVVDALFQPDVKLSLALVAAGMLTSEMRDLALRWPEPEREEAVRLARELAEVEAALPLLQAGEGHEAARLLSGISSKLLRLRTRLAPPTPEQKEACG